MISKGEGSIGTAAGTMLREAGFTVSEECRSRPSCFDFAARRNGNVIFVRALQNISTLPLRDSLELKSISEFFSAAPILLGNDSREKPLEDDTVYSRYHIPVITLKTLENMTLDKAYPLVQASPGGYYVEIDGEAIKRRRQELDLSVGDMAKLIGISRRTVYGYERGMAKASVTAAYKVISTLGVPVAKPLNVFENAKHQHRCCFLTSARRIVAKNALLQRIVSKFARRRITAFGRAPFDFVISVSEDKARILGSVVDGTEEKLNRRLEELLSVSKVVQAHPVLITEGHKSISKDITCVSSDDFSNMKDPEELIAGN